MSPIVVFFHNMSGFHLGQSIKGVELSHLSSQKIIVYPLLTSHIDLAILKSLILTRPFQKEDPLGVFLRVTKLFISSKYLFLQILTYSLSSLQQSFQANFALIYCLTNLICLIPRLPFLFFLQTLSHATKDILFFSSILVQINFLHIWSILSTRSARILKILEIYTRII